MNKKDFLLEKIANICKEKHYSLVTAESCTGGGLAYALTKNSQTSSLLERGYITYSMRSKKEALNVSDYVLQTFGAVSKEVAIEMSEKALQQSRAQISIAVTGLDHEAIKAEGINKPGIVWISCASIHKKSIAKSFKIKGNRENFCEEVIFFGLEMLTHYVDE